MNSTNNAVPRVNPPFVRFSSLRHHHAFLCARKTDNPATQTAIRQQNITAGWPRSRTKKTGPKTLSVNQCRAESFMDGFLLSFVLHPGFCLVPQQLDARWRKSTNVIKRRTIPVNGANSYSRLKRRQYTLFVPCCVTERTKHDKIKHPLLIRAVLHPHRKSDLV